MARFLTSRKFLLALAAIVYALVQTAGGAISPKDALDTIAAVVAAYLAAEGIGDAAARLGSRNDPPGTETGAETAVKR